MSFRQSMENTASDFVSSVAAPVAEQLRDAAEDFIERVGTGSRELGARVGSQVEHLPEAALQRLGLVTAAKARRRTVFGLLVGLVIGAVVVRLFTGEEGARRRHAIRAKFGWEDPQSAAAVTGELPK